MKINLLEQFRSNVRKIRFDPKIRDSFFVSEKQTEFAIKILEDFFPTNYFNIEQGITHLETTGLKANENWVIYHLSQSGNSVGSILIIFEITCLLYYFSSTENIKPLLKSKLKIKNGKINEVEFRSSYFELYTAAIFEKSGFKITLDDQTNPAKPLDILIHTKDDKILTECQTLSESEVENSLIDMLSYCRNSYHKLIEKNQKDFKALHYLPVSLFWIVKDKMKMNLAKKSFKDLLRKYQSDILDVAKSIKQIDVPYSFSNEYCSISIEPFKQGLFEVYDGFFKGSNVGLKFQLFLRKTSEGGQFAENIKLFYTPKLIEERIITAIIH